MVDSITAERLAALQDESADYVLVDTRPPESFEAWHVTGAVNVPYKPGDELDDGELAALRDRLDGAERVLTICAKGVSSDAFGEYLVDNDVAPEVAVVEGGMEAWSRVYDVAAVPLDTDDVEMFQVQRRAKGCLGYVVADPDGGEAAVVDPTRHVEEFRAVADERGYEIVRVFDTHVHADHLSGGRMLADELGVPYHLGERATERGVEFSFDPLARNEAVTVGDVSVKAVPTPGHTSEMTSYLVGDAAVLTADTLFVDAVGRTELEFSEAGAERGARQLFESLHRTLLAEPDSLAVLPGHVTVTSDGRFENGSPGEPVFGRLGDLRTGLDLLSLDEASFVDRIVSRVPEKPPNYETVIDLNRGKRERPDEEEATELELGPNNCAAG